MANIVMANTTGWIDSTAQLFDRSDTAENNRRYSYRLFSDGLNSYGCSIDRTRRRTIAGTVIAYLVMA